MPSSCTSEPRPAVLLPATPNTCLLTANIPSPHLLTHMPTRTSCPLKPVTTSPMTSTPLLWPTVHFLLPPLSLPPLPNDVRPLAATTMHRQAPLPSDHDRNDPSSFPTHIPPIWPLNVCLSLYLSLKYTWPSMIHNATPPSPPAPPVTNPPYTSPSLPSSTYGDKMGCTAMGQIQLPSKEPFLPHAISNTTSSDTAPGS